jgi:hypothetical protein
LNGEGSSGDSIDIFSVFKITVNRRCFLPTYPPLNWCHPEFFHKKKLNILPKPSLWKNEGSPRTEQIFERSSSIVTNQTPVIFGSLKTFNLNFSLTIKIHIFPFKLAFESVFLKIPTYERK